MSSENPEGATKQCLGAFTLDPVLFLHPRLHLNCEKSFELFYLFLDE